MKKENETPSYISDFFRTFAEFIRTLPDHFLHIKANDDPDTLGRVLRDGVDRELSNTTPPEDPRNN